MTTNAQPSFRAVSKALVGTDALDPARVLGGDNVKMASAFRLNASRTPHVMRTDFAAMDVASISPAVRPIRNVVPMSVASRICVRLFLTVLATENVPRMPFVKAVVVALRAHVRQTMTARGTRIA